MIREADEDGGAKPCALLHVLLIYEESARRERERETSLSIEWLLAYEQ